MSSIFPTDFFLSLSVVVVALHEDRLVSCPNVLSMPSILSVEFFLSLSVVVVPLHVAHDTTVGQ
jgi:hypothetical protein